MLLITSCMPYIKKSVDLDLNDETGSLYINQEIRP